MRQSPGSPATQRTLFKGLVRSRNCWPQVASGRPGECLIASRDRLTRIFAPLQLTRLIHCGERVRRNENCPFAQLTSGVCDEISNRPTLVIEVEVLDRADFSVQGTQLVTIHIFSFAQHTHLPLAVITPSVKQEKSKPRQKDMSVLNE